MALTTLLLGVVGIPSIIGFGTSMAGITALGATLTLPILSNLAFMVPRTGNLTAISASFTSTVSIGLLSPIVVHAEVYRASGINTTYNATGVKVDLTFNGGIAIDAFETGTANVTPFPITAGDRLLMVFSASALLLGTVEGSASAGLVIN